MLPEIAPGFFAGCLPRKTTLGCADIPLAADHIEIIPRKDREEIARGIAGGQGLRPFVRQILNQGQVGSCATEATAQAVMVAREFRGLPFTLLNPWFIYYHTSHGRDSGSSIDENLMLARERGIAPESVHPRSLGWRAKPSQEAYAAALEFKIEEFYDVANVDEAESCVLAGWPLVWGARGHAVCKLCYFDPQDANSWGTQYDRNGFTTWEPFSRIDFRYGCFAVRVA